LLRCASKNKKRFYSTAQQRVAQQVSLVTTISRIAQQRTTQRMQNSDAQLSV